MQGFPEHTRSDTKIFCFNYSTGQESLHVFPETYTRIGVQESSVGVQENVADFREIPDARTDF